VRHTRSPRLRAAAFEALCARIPATRLRYVNLGRFYLESANPQAAARYFAEALTIDSGSLPHEAGWLKRKRSSCRTTDSKLPNKDSKICGRLSVRLQPSMRLHLLNGGEPFKFGQRMRQLSGTCIAVV